MGNCIYCKTSLPETFVIDVCKDCGVKVWGEKMFAAIVGNMESARDSGDLYQGSVTNASVKRDGTDKFIESNTQNSPKPVSNPQPTSQPIVSTERADIEIMDSQDSADDLINKLT